ncbi:MAG: NOG1 family protein [Halobacteriaceae archaeon]
MTFERLPTTPRSEELLDQAFSRAARAGRAKSGVEAQESMLLTASNVLHDNLQNVVTSWPDFDEVDPFYGELAGAVARRTVTTGAATDDDAEADPGVDALRTDLSEIQWAARKSRALGREYIGRLPGDPDTARKLRKQGFARMADVVESVADNLAAVGQARDALRELPEIRADDPTVVVAGYPNVGKSSFVNAVTNARNETAAYPFTTQAVRVGHFDRDHLRYQIVDTPGLLDRPAAERNDIESQAVSALTHLADVILLVVDASERCGYPLADQLALRDDLRRRFDVPVLVVCNKSDYSTDVDADHYMSVTEGENVDAVLDAAVDAIDYEPELPFEAEAGAER